MGSNGRRVSQNTIIVMCWMVYSLAYLGRYSYNSNITLIIDHYGITKAQAGLVPTFFFFAYGAGQVINGILCKRYNKKWLFPIALSLSAAINLAVFFNTPFVSIKYLWLLNGLIQSCLWPGIISVISKTIEEKNMGRAMLYLSTTSSTGTILIYVLSSFFAQFDYRYVFLFGAVVMIALGIAWFMIYSPRLEINSGTVEKSEETGEKKKLKGLWTLLTVLAVFSVIHNILKDGLTTWVPDILKERYSLGDSLSILLTVFLPVAGVFGGIISIKISQRIERLETVGALFFAVGAISIGAIAIVPGMNVVAAVIFFGTVVCMMHGINNVVITIAPLRLRDSLDSGKMAGIMNGFCYVGSTISAYGLGMLADRGGWQNVLITLLGICVFAAVIGAGSSLINRKKQGRI